MIYKGKGSTDPEMIIIHVRVEEDSKSECQFVMNWIEQSVERNLNKRSTRYGSAERRADLNLVYINSID